MKRFFGIFVFFALFFPLFVLAHQPNIVTNARVEVKEPEISKAYYGELQKSPHSYHFSTNQSIDFYVGLLVPEKSETRKDFIIRILNDGVEVQILSGASADWKVFHEPFANDYYLNGPEYSTILSPGNYEIIVSNGANEGKYVLAVGKKEFFGIKETINSLNAILELKQGFFSTSPVTFLFSPFGVGYVVAVFIISFIFAFLYRFIMKVIPRKSTLGISHNIGLYDRLIRFVFSVVLFLLAIFTSWNFFILFFSGFCLFEAIFSWCGLYALIGRNTCPIDV